MLCCLVIILFKSDGQLLLSPAAMYDNLSNQAGVQRPPVNPQPNPFGNAFYGAGSGLIRGGLGAYGEKFLGSSSEFMQSNVLNMSMENAHQYSTLSIEINNLSSAVRSICKHHK